MVIKLTKKYTPQGLLKANWVKVTNALGFNKHSAFGSILINPF